MSAIYVDGDACPVKEETLRVAERFGVMTHLVANRRLRVGGGPLVRHVVVDDGFDAADDWIATHAGPGDVVVTGDIQLAERCLKAGAAVIGPNGKPFTPDNIGAALAMRALNRDLRDMGAIKGGNAAFTPADRSRFLQQLDRALRRPARK